MQGYLGCGHLVNDYEMVLERVTKELENINESNDSLIEEISDNFVRVYLKPYYEKYKTFDKLIDSFINSSKERGDINGFLNELEELSKTLNANDQMFLNNYLKNGKYLISHSQIYRDNYNPHYLVIHKKYL